MLYQSGTRSQRPRGFKVKQTLQIALILAVCFWLLYQVKNSHDKSKGYGSAVENNVSKEQVSLDLGRKGNVGSTNGTERTLDDRSPTLEVENHREDRGGGDDELDKNVEEKAEIDSFDKEHENPKESLTNHEVDNEKEPDTTQDEPVQHNEEQEDKDNITSESVTDNEEGGVEKEPNDHQKESHIYDKFDTDTQLTAQEIVGSDTEQDAEQHIEHIDETAPPPSGIDQTSVTDQEEKENEVESFHDVNGAPPEDHEPIVNSISNENSSDEQTTSLDQDTGSGPNDQPGHGKYTIQVAEEFDNSTRISSTNDVVLQTVDKVSDGEAAEINSTDGGTNTNNIANEVTAGSESADNIDKSSVIDTLKTSQENIIVLEDSTAVHSQKNQEVASSLKMLPKENNSSQSED